MTDNRKMASYLASNYDQKTERRHMETAILEALDRKDAEKKEAVNKALPAFGEFRQSLRQILADNGITSNPGSADEEILSAIRKLVSEKKEAVAKAWEEGASRLGAVANAYAIPGIQNEFRERAAEIREGGGE